MIDRLILASASASRLETLRRAGVSVSVIVSGVDESGVTASSTDALVRELARLKAESVFGDVEGGDVAVLGCDSLLDLDGRPQGKPASRADAVAAWRAMRGRTGTLYTGHHLITRLDGQVRRQTVAAGTRVTFADLDDAEIEAYAATGEPDHVAGAFTIDGLGGAFVTSIEGDPHNVIGVSLPLLRRLLAASGVPWIDLWRPDLRAHQ